MEAAVAGKACMPKLLDEQFRGDTHALYEALSHLLKHGRSQPKAAALEAGINRVVEGLKPFQDKAMTLIMISGDPRIEAAVRQLAESLHTFASHAVFAVTHHAASANQDAAESERLQKLLARAESVLRLGALEQETWCKDAVREAHLLVI